MTHQTPIQFICLLSAAALCIQSHAATNVIKIPPYDWRTNGIYYTNISLIWADVKPRTNFLTISSNQWFKLNGAAIVRVNDRQWKAITNAYKAHVTNTSTLYFQKEIE